MPTWVAACVWLIVLGNAGHLTCMRAEPLGPRVQTAGYVLLALQVASFLLCQTTEPGQPPAAWIAAVKEGGSNAPSFSRHPDIAGLCIPPRARYVWRSKVVVLHFDHFCWFLQRNIGLRNRKFFILFVLYSISLCSFALIVCLCDLLPPLVRGYSGKPLDGFAGSTFDVDTSSMPVEVAREAIYDAHMSYEFHELEQRLGPRYVWWSYVFIALNFAAMCFLGDLGGRAVSHALRNRVLLSPDDDRYDVGLWKNIRAVFGDVAALWLLPLPGTASSGDGLSFPLNPHSKFDPELEARSENGEHED